MAGILRGVRELLLGGALATLLWNFVVTPLKLGSDAPVGWAVANRLSYRFREPRVGERVAFLQPDRPERVRLGRIAGLPLDPSGGDRSVPMTPAGHYRIRLERSGLGPSRLIGAVPRLYILGPVWPDGR